MLFNEKELKRLNKIFATLSEHKYLSVVGLERQETGSSDYLVITRGPMIVDGFRELDEIVVIAGKENERITIGLEDDGPWWTYLRKELKKMEAELAANLETLEDVQAKAQAQEKKQRDKELEKAKAVFKEMPK